MYLRSFIVALVFAAVHSFAVFAQQTSVFGDLGNGMFRNPVLPSDYSDPDVIRVGEDYYGIASTFFFSPGMVVIHSKDLVHWEIINHVVDDISFLNPELDWTKMKGYYNGVWAGSLRYHQGTFYCHFATPRGGWFVATTTDIRGKWEVQAMKDANGRELRGRGWDDVCPLWDDDGQAYIIASNFGKHWFPHIYKMSWDKTLYAFVIRWDGAPFTIQAVNGQDIKDISLLTDGSPVTFKQTDKGVRIEANMTDVTDPAVAFRIRLKH